MDLSFRSFHRWALGLILGGYFLCTGLNLSGGGEVFPFFNWALFTRAAPSGEYLGFACREKSSGRVLDSKLLLRDLSPGEAAILESVVAPSGMGEHGEASRRTLRRVFPLSVYPSCWVQKYTYRITLEGAASEPSEGPGVLF